MTIKNEQGILMGRREAEDLARTILVIVVLLLVIAGTAWRWRHQLRTS